MNAGKLNVIAHAIAHYEGFDATGNKLPKRLNNPGDLVFVHQNGATAYNVTGPDGKTRTYAQFFHLEDGWRELNAQIERDAARGLTIAAWMARYAPAEDANDPKSYAAFIAEKLGVPVTTKLSDLLA